jgi:hypothetical protein
MKLKLKIDWLLGSTKKMDRLLSLIFFRLEYKYIAVNALFVLIRILAQVLIIDACLTSTSDTCVWSKE